MNYYEILEISQNASDEVIKMAYKALILKYHPDTYCGDKNYAEEMTKKINEAYNVLKDKDRRLEYDIKLRYNSNNKNMDSQKEKSNTNNIDEENHIYDAKNIVNQKLINKETIKVYILIFIMVMIISIICSFMFFNNTTNIDNNSIVKEYQTIESSGKIINTIQCSTSGYIYQLSNGEYWYSNGVEIDYNNITILSNQKGNYIIEGFNREVYKVENAYQSRIKETFEGFENRSGVYYGDRNNKGWFILENGQIWRQNDLYEYTQLIENPEVTIFFISNYMYNGYYLCVNSINKAVKVENVSVY